MDNSNMEDDFQFVHPQDDTLKKISWSSLYTSGKCKLMGSLYNIVHSRKTYSPVGLLLIIIIIARGDIPVFSSSPIVLLGASYLPYTVGREQDFEQTSTLHIDEFMQDFYSILWFCYRKDFPALEPTHHTTDTGWGCMLRTGNNNSCQQC
jgi:hypothetical protein